jgi:hypothetical protein
MKGHLVLVSRSKAVVDYFNLRAEELFIVEVKSGQELKTEIQ